MNITKEMLETIYLRGENLDKISKMDDILNSCLGAAINGFDFESFEYDEDNQREMFLMSDIRDELKQLGFRAHFDGDEGNMHMTVSWS